MRQELRTKLIELLSTHPRLQERSDRDAWVLQYLPENVQTLLVPRDNDCHNDLVFIVSALESQVYTNGTPVILDLIDPLVLRYVGLQCSNQLADLRRNILEDLRAPLPYRDVIMSALYLNHSADPEESGVDLAGFYRAVSILLGDRGEESRVRAQLHSLRKEKLVDYEEDPDSAKTVLRLRPKGVQDASNYRREYSPIERACPTTLHQFIACEPECASIIRRDDLIQEITGALDQQADGCHFIVVYGQPLVGKTRLLMGLAEMLSDRYAPLVVTGQGFQLPNAPSGPADFAFDLADQLTRRFNQWAGWRGTTPVGYPTQASFEGRAKIAFSQHWGGILSAAGGVKPLVIIDEVERLLDHREQVPSEPLDEVLTLVDDFVRDPANGLFVLAGSERIRYSQNERFSNLIAKAEKHIRVGHYTREAVKTILSSLQRYVPFSDKALRRFEALWDGHPRLLRIALDLVLAQHRNPDRRSLDGPGFEELLDGFLEQAADSLWALCQRLLPEERGVVWLIANGLAGLPSGSSCSLDRLIQLAGCCNVDGAIDPHDALGRGLEHLHERRWIRWIDREKGLFRFDLGVVPLWVQRHRLSLADWFSSP